MHAAEANDSDARRTQWSAICKANINHTFRRWFQTSNGNLRLKKSQSTTQTTGLNEFIIDKRTQTHYALKLILSRGGNQMPNQENLQLFEDQPIRTAWNEEEEEWYFSIVDVVGVLTDQPDIRHAAKYWSVLKVRLKAEGSELPTNCSQLKLKAADGKRRLTDVANTEQLLRIIQSIPSKKAEPFKLWLAQVGRERIEETLDPELIADRLVSTYERAGYTQEWINQRLQSISARKELTDEWKSRGVQKGKEYAILTDELTRAWSGMTTRQYKNLKGLKKQSLRDNMSTTELTLNQLAEVATRELSQQERPEGFDANKRVAQAGGSVAGNARKDLERRLGRPVITSANAAQLSHVVTQMIEASAATAGDDKDTPTEEQE